MNRKTQDSWGLWVEWLYVLLAFGTVVLSIYPMVPSLRFFEEYAHHWMFLYLFLGLVFLVFHWPRLMWTSFMASAALSIFLKYSSNPQLQYRPREDWPDVRIAQVSLTELSLPMDTLRDYLAHARADVVLFEGWTPMHERMLTGALQQVYPHSVRAVRADDHGKACFARIPIRRYDTLFIGQFPQLMTFHKTLDGRRLYVVNVYFAPPITPLFQQQYHHQMRQLIDTLRTIKAPLVVGGHFHLPSWAYELRFLRSALRLQNSRRDALRVAEGSIDLSTPMQHLFYNDSLQCVGFEKLMTASGKDIGIIARYQWIQMVQL